MSDTVERYIHRRLQNIGYDVFFDDNHESSPLENLFIDAFHELSRTRYSPEGFRNLHFFEEAIVHPVGTTDLNNVSPYDFLIVYNDQIALVEIDGAYHFFHETNSSNIQLNERRKQKRMAIDRSKLEFSFASGISMLRIAYCDIGNVEDILRTFLDEMFYTGSTVIMYSNESIYQHLIPTDTSFVRSEHICFYDRMCAAGMEYERMIVSRPDKFNYDALDTKNSITPMFISDESCCGPVWLSAVPVSQNFVY